jgi:hypothetical protein
LPGAQATVLWNDRVGDHFVCHILDIDTRQRRTIDAPVYALSPDGTWAVSTDFDVLFGMTREEFDAQDRPGGSDPGGR